MKAYQIEIVKLGRKNYKCLCDGKYNVDIQIAAFPGLKAGDTLTVYGEWERTNYGSTFVAYSAAELEEKEAQVKRDEIERWWGYVQKTYRERGYIYERGVDELHKLGVHEYDAQIASWNAAIEAEKQAEKAAREAEYAREKAERDAARRAEEAKYSHLRLPAYRGFAGRPQKGERMLRDGRAYEVVSSYYNSEDGFSFGVMYEEWYAVKALDITDTEAGREMIERDAAEKAKAQAERESKQRRDAAAREIRKIATETGERPETAEPSGEIVLDTTNVYGGGEMIYRGADAVWYVQNNGADGDNWSLNNVRTGGAGAIGWKIGITDEITALLERLA